MRQAFASGLLRPVPTSTARQALPAEFSLDLAADIATEVFIERLAMLIEDDEYLPADEEECDSAVLRLFARIMGRRPGSRADIEALDVEGTKAFLQERLAALVAQARSTRQPIPDSELAALCVEPVDLLDIRWSRNRPSPRWCELDEREVVQLDPEGLSLIAFRVSQRHRALHLPPAVSRGRDLSRNRSCAIWEVDREKAGRAASSSGGPSPRRRAGSTRSRTSCANWGRHRCRLPLQTRGETGICLAAGEEISLLGRR